ncbi:ER membrane protein complex subunit 7 [Teratosphaeria destructans]|uniref:ER membrane protein complex subunit 7 n=1 Tax=Teratosphaeria destructans TaxID=418781 RepID=A0A9W7T1A5_9PEZI|nr:ER membrane protein complex subunit 7 [Teratosphaeria destructans]
MRSIMSLTVLCLSTLASAARLTVNILPSQHLNPSTLPASTHAVLTGPPGVRYDVPLRRDNTFALSNLAPSSYLLTIHSRDHFFSPLRVDVSQGEGEGESIQAWQTYRGNEWGNKGVSYGSGTGELSIDVQAGGKKEFYQDRGGFNLLAFFKSPMILMALVSVVFIFGMPYLVENMDPETRAEFEEMQKKGPLMGSAGAANSMQNFDLAGFLAGKSSDGGSSGGARKR